jgi:hypothetical protein
LCFKFKIKKIFFYNFKLHLGPLFNINSPAERLNTNDAAYTEALHTNAGTLGFDQPITHASFYPNWGTTQPGKILIF